MRFACAILLVCLAGCAARPAAPAHPPGPPIVLRPPSLPRQAAAPAVTVRGASVEPRGSPDTDGRAARQASQAPAQENPAVPEEPDAPPPPADSPAQVLRDTAALNTQATEYVISPDSSHTVVENLARLNGRAMAALQRLKQRKDTLAAQARDVAAARAAADALADYLATEAKPARPPEAASVFAPPAVTSTGPQKAAPQP